MNPPKRVFNDRELSNAERAVIVGLNRQGASLLEVMGILELKQITIENVLQNYFGKRLTENKNIKP